MGLVLISVLRRGNFLLLLALVHLTWVTCACLCLCVCQTETLMGRAMGEVDMATEESTPKLELHAP